MMRVTVRLGEPFWRAAGEREVALDLPTDSTVADALAELTRRIPGLAADLGGEVTPAIFLDDSEATPDAVLKPGDRLHVVWPVSGG